MPERDRESDKERPEGLQYKDCRVFREKAIAKLKEAIAGKKGDRVYEEGDRVSDAIQCIRI